MAIRGGLGP